MKKQIRLYGLMVAVLLSVTACSNDDEDQPYEPEEGDEVVVDKFDELEWFVGNLIGTDTEGNRNVLLWGQVLDEASPRDLSIFVESWDEAESIFCQWLAPGSENHLEKKDNDVLVYSPTSEENEPQGTITLTRSASNGRYAELTFSADAEPDAIRTIRFIDRAQSPHNGRQCFSPMAVGEIVDFNTEEGTFSGVKWEGVQKAVVIREATENRKGLILYVSDTKVFRNGLGASSHQLLPKSMANEVSEIFKKNWSNFQKYYSTAGHKLSDTDKYWLQDTKFYVFVGYRYALNLKTGEVTRHKATAEAKPKRPYLMYKTFDCVYI